MKLVAKSLLMVLGSAVIIACAISLFTWDKWWITGISYVWEKLTLVSIVALALSFWALPWKRRIWTKLYLAVLTVAVCYQFYVLLPYTVFYPKAIANVVPVTAPFQLMVSNVKMTNRESARYLALVKEINPDIVQVIELNEWWQQQLSSLRLSYPYYIEQPHNDAYGMGIYSRFPLQNTKIYHLENATTPSIYTELTFPTGQRVGFYALHPRPPLPSNSVEIADKELLQVARMVKTATLPVVIAGDFNDVPWSHTLQEFRKISGLQAVRVGRGFYNTFGVERFWLRSPLDHVYLTDKLGLVAFQRLPAFGSDHFALLATLTIQESQTHPAQSP